MEVNQVNRTQTPSRYGSYLQAMDQCPLCSTPLEIQYKVNREEFQVVEEAQCPSCKAKSVSKKHKLQ